MMNITNHTNVFTDKAFYAPDWQPVAAPVLPTLPDAHSYLFEVEDSRIGRSIVAIALNHGNPNLKFKEVRQLAESFEIVKYADEFQGIVLSDTPSGGANRLIFGDSRWGAFDDTFQIPDTEHLGTWHIFSLFCGKTLTGFRVGDGFLLISAKNSFVFAQFMGRRWLIGGGGGSAYETFLIKALREANRTGTLYSAITPTCYFPPVPEARP